MNQLHQRCTGCLMLTTYPGIRFDDKGICNHCLEYEKPKLYGEELFSRKISSKRRNKYDCVLGISGGKDSCYVAYLAKEKFKLRTLAVFYDSPFYCDLARQNIESVCNALDLDLITIRSKNNLEYNLLRNHLISLAATGTTWGHCMFCHYGIDAILWNIASEKKIPFILSGVTKNELWNPGNRTKILLNRVKKLPLNEFITFAYYQSKAYVGLVDQRRQFKIPDNNCFSVYKKPALPLNGSELLHVFDYIPWNQAEIEKTLSKETEWVKPEKALSWRYDCILEPLLDYTYKREFGISTVGLYLSGLIRSGQISRDEALRIQEQTEDEEALRNDVESVFNYLQIPKPIQNKFFNAL